MADEAYSLILNAGSSSIKAALYRQVESRHVLAVEASVDKIGTPHAVLHLRNDELAESVTHAIVAETTPRAVDIIIEWATQTTKDHRVLAVAHRIVHGGTRFKGPELLTDGAIDELRALVELDPDHLPIALMLIEEITLALPNVPQIACFDTALYAELPRVAQQVAIPRKYEAMGVRRYGFHGLSYEYLLNYMKKTCGEAAANGRIVLAHLGSGVSLTAMSNGKPIDTTMGFTPASGVPMSTRSGDVDPGIFWFLHNRAQLSAEQIDEVLNKQSGLLGVSELSADMYELLQQEDNNQNAAEAVQLFCYQVKKSIGALVAALGGVDSIVFAGGMGENAPKIRTRIMNGLEYLGAEIDEERNLQGSECISRDGSQVGVHVFHTDEGLVMLEQIDHVLTRTE